MFKLIIKNIRRRLPESSLSELRQSLSRLENEENSPEKESWLLLSKWFSLTRVALKILKRNEMIIQ